MCVCAVCVQHMSKFDVDLRWHRHTAGPIVDVDTNTMYMCEGKQRCYFFSPRTSMTCIFRAGIFCAQENVQKHRVDWDDMASSIVSQLHIWMIFFFFIVRACCWRNCLPFNRCTCYRVNNLRRSRPWRRPVVAMTSLDSDILWRCHYCVMFAHMTQHHSIW